jgi:hypothetical protein
MVEKFTRALVIIEREQFEAQKRSEMLQSVRLSFSEHLQFFEGLDLRGVEGPDLNRELTRALSALDDARTEFIRTLPRITVDSPEAAHAAADLGTHGAADSPQGFSDWLRNGFAFTLPLLVVGMLIFFALLLAPRR